MPRRRIDPLRHGVSAQRCAASSRRAKNQAAFRGNELKNAPRGQEKRSGWPGRRDPGPPGPARPRSAPPSERNRRARRGQCSAGQRPGPASGAGDRERAGWAPRWGRAAAGCAGRAPRGVRGLSAARPGAGARAPGAGAQRGAGGQGGGGAALPAGRLGKRRATHGPNEKGRDARAAERKSVSGREEHEEDTERGSQRSRVRARARVRASERERTAMPNGLRRNAGRRTNGQRERERERESGADMAPPPPPPQAAHGACLLSFSPLLFWALRQHPAGWPTGGQARGLGPRPRPPAENKRTHGSKQSKQEEKKQKEAGERAPGVVQVTGDG